MSRSITIEEAMSLLHVEPAIPESDDPREHEPHALWQGEPYSLDYVRRILTVCASSTPPRLCVMVSPDGDRMVMGVGHNRVYHFDARPFTDAELAAGVFALLSGDRAQAVDPTVLDGDAARVIRIRAESYCDGWQVGVWGLALGHAAKRLWWAKGTTFNEATDNLRSILSTTYGVPND